MTHRLTLICAVRAKRPCFPGGEAADDAGPAIDVTPEWRVLQADRYWRAPDGLARRTAEWFGVDALVSDGLAEIDYGAWRGRALDDVARDEPDAFKVWLTDPTASPHGGESFSDLLSRVGGWLGANQSLSGHSVAIASASVVNACVLASLGAPATAFFRIDAEPLSLSKLVSDGRRWSVRSLNGRPAGRSRGDRHPV
ncbi:histidine phosphatase family protein [Chelatococcus sambhunathii]|uniref:Histidine phosphatase family protein n=1 Tax=Chelatococcus sambhunathii TaxID=363953 RepID=A0ABU1DEP0_9HYPH|nr:histidine phosphatase family protein [Chelatococcus sambhunathii]MDR4306596.1 histidine phosphatase family protein [Chelatococcus sambhunathii]